MCLKVAKKQRQREGEEVGGRKRVRKGRGVMGGGERERERMLMLVGFLLLPLWFPSKPPAY
jgi:hypothetical protein